MRYRFTKNEIMETVNYDGSFTLSITIDGQYKYMTYIGYPRKVAYSKFQQEFGIYPYDYKPIATMCMCNFGGIAVMEIKHDLDDYVIVCDDYGDGYKNITKNLIRYNAKGEPYFVRYGQRFYFKDMMMKC